MNQQAPTAIVRAAFARFGRRPGCVLDLWRWLGARQPTVRRRRPARIIRHFREMPLGDWASAYCEGCGAPLGEFHCLYRSLGALVMTTTATSIDTICVHCGGRQADSQTGRCLTCGKMAVSPALVAEFSHPVLDGHAGERRPSPSAAYRGNGSHPSAEPPLPPPAAETGSLATPAVEPAPASPAPTVDQEVVRRAAAWALAPEDHPAPVATFRLPETPATTKWIVETRALRDKLLARADNVDTLIGELKAEAAQHRESARAFSQLLDQVVIGAASPGCPTSPGVDSTALPETAKARGKWSKRADACVECGKSNVPQYSLDRCKPCYRLHYARTRKP